MSAHSPNDELMEQLFPEQSQAEQLLALATNMQFQRHFVDGQMELRFQISGSVPIGSPKSKPKNKAWDRMIHFHVLLIQAEDQINAQGKARAAASKSRRRRTTGKKGGAK